MPRYLILSKYSASGAAGLLKDGFGARQALGTKGIESTEGTVESWVWLDRTTWDFAAVVTVPSTESLIRIFSFAWASGTFDRTEISEVFDSATMDRVVATGIDWRPPGAG